eukprot:jgi/Bigna1/88986/estExt_fgenesh1_pg.C_410133
MLAAYLLLLLLLLLLLWPVAVWDDCTFRIPEEACINFSEMRLELHDSRSNEVIGCVSLKADQLLAQLQEERVAYGAGNVEKSFTLALGDRPHHRDRVPHGQRVSFIIKLLPADDEEGEVFQGEVQMANPHSNSDTEEDNLIRHHRPMFISFKINARLGVGGKHAGVEQIVAEASQRLRRSSTSAVEKVVLFASQKPTKLSLASSPPPEEKEEEEEEEKHPQPHATIFVNIPAKKLQLSEPLYIRLYRDYDDANKDEDDGDKQKQKRAEAMIMEAEIENVLKIRSGSEFKTRHGHTLQIAGIEFPEDWACTQIRVASVATSKPLAKLSVSVKEGKCILPLTSAESCVRAYVVSSTILEDVQRRLQKKRHGGKYHDSNHSGDVKLFASQPIPSPFLTRETLSRASLDSAALPSRSNIGVNPLYRSEAAWEGWGIPVEPGDVLVLEVLKKRGGDNDDDESALAWEKDGKQRKAERKKTDTGDDDGDDASFSDVNEAACFTAIRMTTRELTPAGGLADCSSIDVFLPLLPPTTDFHSSGPAIENACRATSEWIRRSLPPEGSSPSSPPSHNIIQVALADYPCGFLHVVMDFTSKAYALKNQWKSFPINATAVLLDAMREGKVIQDGPCTLTISEEMESASYQFAASDIADEDADANMERRKETKARRFVAAEILRLEARRSGFRILFKNVTLDVTPDANAENENAWYKWFMMLQCLHEKALKRGPIDRDSVQTVRKIIGAVQKQQSDMQELIELVETKKEELQRVKMLNERNSIEAIMEDVASNALLEKLHAERNDVPSIHEMKGGNAVAIAATHGMSFDGLPFPLEYYRGRSNYERLLSDIAETAGKYLDLLAIEATELS